ncbi:MAG: winged helix DNA-binding protein [Sphingomonas sp.]
MATSIANRAWAGADPAWIPADDAQFFPARQLAPVRAMIARRRLRDRYFPGDLFADPVWDILLELTAAKLDRKSVPMSALCAAAAVPTTTALRHIHDLESLKLVVRHNDPNDKRRAFIELSPEAFEAMMAYLATSEVIR